MFKGWKSACVLYTGYMWCYQNATVLVHGLPILADHVVLVNGEIIILDVRELCDRNLHDVPQAVAVFQQKTAV